MYFTGLILPFCFTGPIVSIILWKWHLQKILKKDLQLKNYCRYKFVWFPLVFLFFLSYKMEMHLIWLLGILICLFLCSVLQHPFVTQPLNRSLAIELLDKMNNPDHSTYHDFDDDDPEVGICYIYRIRLNLFSNKTKWLAN